VTATAVGARLRALPGALATQEFTGVGEKGAMKMNNRVTKGRAKSVALAAALAAGTMGYAHAADMPVKTVPAVPFFLVNDNAVSFTWFPNATDPGVPGGAGSVAGGIPGTGNTFSRYEIDLTHFDVWQYGTNFIGFFGQQYGSQDPNTGTPGNWGDREVDLITNSTLGWNELTHSKMFSNFLVKDISFEYHMFLEEQDGGIQSESSQFAGGLQFLLNLPGTVALSVWADKEINHNVFMSCGPGFPITGACPIPTQAFSGDRYLDWTPKLNLSITEPLTFVPSWFPLTWGNTTTVTFPKGTGISAANTLAECGGAVTAACLANSETKTELWEDNRLTLDASKVWWGKPGIWDIYGGYRYWYNKFGTDHTAPLFSQVAPGTSIESTAYVGTTYHFK
jgi:hypothetical protein